MTAAEMFGGKVAAITGAGSGIGEALAREAARHGMKVALSDINGDSVRKVADDIRKAGGEVTDAVVDTRDPKAVEAFAEQVYSKFGEVRLLINNAGIEMVGLSWELTPEQWQHMMNVNVLGPIHGVRAFVPRMKKTISETNRATIANVASIGGFAASAMQSAYMVSKHAMINFTENLFLEMEFTKTPIDVSVIVPGAVDTPIFRNAVVSTGADGAMAEKHRQDMIKMMASVGMKTDQAAANIFEHLANRDFWASTDVAATRAAAGERADHIKNLTPPKTNEFARQLLDNLL